jgi:uncharacterized protein (DUF488 family)
MLAAHHIEHLVDVRKIPKSGRHPHFNHDALELSLRDAGIAYTHLPGLGGLRHPRKDSINTAWRNDSFRGYADYMQSSEFETNLLELIAIAERLRTVIMCAEAVPWRCHRSLIADALTAHGIVVKDIMSATTCKPHAYTPFARVNGTEVTYPGLPLSSA